MTYTTASIGLCVNQNSSKAHPLKAAKNFISQLILKPYLLFISIFALLLFCVSTPTFAGTDQNQPPELSDEDVDQISTDLAEAIKQSFEIVKKYEDEEAENIKRVMLLVHEIQDYAKQKREELKPDAYLEYLDQNKIEINDALGLGRVRITLINKKETPRVILNGDDTTYLVLQRKDFNTESAQNTLLEYIARQHIEGLEMKGRPVKIIWINDKEFSGKFLEEFIQEVTDLENHPLPEGIRDYLKQWVKATHKSPTKKDVVWGLWSAVGQVVISAALGYAIHGNFPMAALLFNFGFGSLLGINNPTYRNLMWRGSPNLIFMKGLVLSLSFSYPFAYLANGGMKSLYVSTVNFKEFGKTLYANHITRWGNAFLHNLNRTETSSFFATRTKLRLNQKPIYFPILKTEHKMRPFVEGQLGYLYTFALKMFDQFEFWAGKIPVSKITLLAAWKLNHDYSTWYANFRRSPTIEFHIQKMKEDWERQTRYLKIVSGYFLVAPIIEPTYSLGKSLVLKIPGMPRVSEFLNYTASNWPELVYNVGKTMLKPFELAPKNSAESVLNCVNTLEIPKTLRHAVAGTP